MRTDGPDSKPSLESLIESGDLGIEALHPGGLAVTRRLAELCLVGAGTSVLDVACGTGETACFLVARLGASVVGVDRSPELLRRAREKARERGLAVEFREGDALELDFADGTFDAVISECSLCLLDKQRAVAEMVRVAKPGGRVGMHDICWKADTPDRLKRRLARLEGEVPETAGGWQSLLGAAGLVDVGAIDASGLIPQWTRAIKQALGVWGQLKIFSKLARRWGLGGLFAVLGTERIFSSRYTGYAIVVGRKP